MTARMIWKNSLNRPLMPADFFFGVREIERTQIKHAEQSEPDEAIVRTRPQKAGKKNGADDEHATHGRRSLLAEVQFCQPVDFFRRANRLAQLERRQLADDEVPEDQ